MNGTNPGGDDPLALTELNEPGSGGESFATLPDTSISDVSQRHPDEDRAKLGLLLEKLERIPIPEVPEPSPFIENDWLPLGWEWREGENGIVLPVGPPRDPNEPLTEIIRFLDHANGTINGRPIRPGTIAEIDSQTANRLFAYRPMGLTLDQWPAKVEYASQDDLDRYEAVMREVDQNEEATANDPLSQKLGMVSAETPKLIVRFIRHGMASDKRVCGVGEVWPVEKELAVRHLLEKEPVVELATPEELRRDRNMIGHIEEQSKSQVEATRTHRFKNGPPHSVPKALVVQFLTPGRFAIHMAQGIVYEKRAEGCETLPCAAGEIWEIEQDYAYQLLRGKSPIGTLATDAEWDACRAKLTGEPTAVEPVEQGQTNKGGKTVKPKKSTANGDARAKLIGALTTHHQYSNGSCGDYQPIGINALARQAEVAPSTALAFFRKQFKSHKNYQRGCKVKSTLISVLKLLNDEFTPDMLIQRAAPESDRKQPDTDED